MQSRKSFEGLKFENFGGKIESEMIKGVEYYNFCGKNTSEVLRYFPHDLKGAEKIVLLPDLCPGKSPLPTGCAVEINRGKQKDWRKFAISDVGCGMLVLGSKVSWSDFDENRDSWDEIYRKLKENKGKLGDLGSGNHFLDATIDDDDEMVHFIIHTGSREESKTVEGLVDNPKKFDKKYNEVVDWARRNREAIAEILEKVYGRLEIILDKSHNGYEVDENSEKVIIRKGAVKLEPEKLAVIPSTMDGEMALVEGKESMDQVLQSMSHGTGRVKSRSQSKEEATRYDFEALRGRIYIPKNISNASIRTENPSCYRDLGECLGLVDRLVGVKERLTPIAYIGQV